MHTPSSLTHVGKYVKNTIVPEACKGDSSDPSNPIQVYFLCGLFTEKNNMRHVAVAARKSATGALNHMPSRRKAFERKYSSGINMTSCRKTPKKMAEEAAPIDWKYLVPRIFITAKGDIKRNTRRARELNKSKSLSPVTKRLTMFSA